MLQQDVQLRGRDGLSLTACHNAPPSRCFWDLLLESNVFRRAAANRANLQLEIILAQRYYRVKSIPYTQFDCFEARYFGRLLN